MATGPKSRGQRPIFHAHSRKEGVGFAEAEITRFNVEVSTNFQVVAAQDALTSPRLSGLQAVINFINAIDEFERVQGLGW